MQGFAEVASLLPTAIASIAQLGLEGSIFRMVHSRAVGWCLLFSQDYGIEGLNSSAYGLLHRLFGLPHGLLSDFQEQRSQKNQIQAVAF